MLVLMYIRCYYLIYIKKEVSMVKRVFVEEIKQEIIQEYTKDVFCTIASLSRKYSCSRGMIRNLLISKKIDIRGQAEAQIKENVITEKDLKRFWKKVDVQGLDDCWEWQASQASGYGVFGFRKRRFPSHRFSYLVSHGDIGELHVLHSCDNPLCCNPKHLFLGSHQENMTDRNKKGRASGGSLKGEESPNAKFTNNIVLKMRELYANGIKQDAIARKFNTSQTVVSGIVSRKYWKHI